MIHKHRATGDALARSNPGAGYVDVPHRRRAAADSPARLPRGTGFSA
ncbi:hypothetical protein ACIF85_20680 [Streptomyces sp. NPDC086033]